MRLEGACIEKGLDLLWYEDLRRIPAPLVRWRTARVVTVAWFRLLPPSLAGICPDARDSQVEVFAAIRALAIAGRCLTLRTIQGGYER